MASAPLTSDQCQEAIQALAEAGTKSAAAKLLGIPLSTFVNRLRTAERLGLELPVRDEVPQHLKQLRALKDQVETLTEYNKHLSKQVQSTDSLKKIIHGCPPKFSQPKWIKKSGKGRTTGTPVIFGSDWHFDEVVDPKQVNHVNAYNREIATRRIHHFIETAIELLVHHMASPKYDGVVFAMGGDMLSGNIHEELAQTNEYPILQSVVDLAGIIVRVISRLHEVFGNVYVPCVPGNHGRLTHKPSHKNKVYDNYDWLLYQMVARDFKDAKDIQFDVSDSTEHLFNIYDTSYLLTHGDDFRGGSGIAGALSPLMLGDHRKRKRQMAVSKPYDYLICGHWHQYMHVKGLIVNGSIKGYCEYAMHNSFDFELPTQAMWITHPDIGITARWPIFLEKRGYAA